jgi:hypothetical protein
VVSDPSGGHNFREIVPILAAGGPPTPTPEVTASLSEVGDPKISGANFLKSGSAGDVRSA